MAAGLADSTEAGPDHSEANSSFVGFLAGPPRLQYDVDLSADGRIVASGGQTESGEGGLLLVFDAEARAQVGAPRRRVTDPRRRRQRRRASRARRRVPTARSTCSTPAPVRRTRRPATLPTQGRVTRAIFRPGGEQFVVMTSGGEIAVFDRASMTADRRLHPAGPRWRHRARAGRHVGRRRAGHGRPVPRPRHRSTRVEHRSRRARRRTRPVRRHARRRQPAHRGRQRAGGVDLGPRVGPDRG